MYATSHNATGYNEDMNPDLMDGRSDPRDTWASNNVKKALRAEAIIRSLDPDRIVYHHASGNLGPMHLCNFYPNFVPIQELSDWFGHWAAQGVKPAFMCEYGAPFTWAGISPAQQGLLDINPATFTAQIQGGAIYGLSSALAQGYHGATW
jgi:hypothetical protein